MSYTNLQMVTGAFQRIGVVDETESPSPTQAANALNILNGYMATIAVDGIKLGYYAQTTLPNTVPLRDSDYYDVQTLLCKQLAIAYGISLKDKTELLEELVQADRRLTKRALLYFESDLSELPRPQGGPWGGPNWL